MDSLTQIVLGAAVAEAVAGKKMGNKAALWGALAGTIPDLDVFFMALFHPIDAALVHRGISHSLLFALGMGPLLGWLFFHIYKRKYNLSTWIWLFFLGIVTHPILDMFTNYGTSFLWPLPLRITFNSVFVIDPLYTVPFMILLICALCLSRDNPKRRRLNWAGIVYSSGYLIWGVIVKLSILSTGTNYFTSNGYREPLKTSIVTPMPFTSFYWMVMVEDDSAYYIGYKSIFYPFDPTQVDTIQKNHTQLESLKWSGKNYSKQLSFISNSLYTTTQLYNQTYFYDLRFGVLSQLTARKMNEPMMGFSLITQGNQVVRVERKRPNGSFQSFDFAYYWHQLFVGQHPSN